METAIERYPETVGFWATPKGAPIMFRYRENTNDWNTVNACVGTNDEYGLRDISTSGRVLDLGGYLGSVGVTVAVDNPAAQVTIIEPVPSNARLIRANIELNKVGDRVTLIEGAVGEGGESVSVWFGYLGTELAEHHAFVGNSSLAYDNGGPLEHDEAQYTALSIEELVGDGLDLLKIDCEGGEWSFLHGPALSRVKRIVGEAHSVRGRRGDDIIGVLSATHDVTLSGNPDDIARGGTCGFSAVLR